MDKKTNEKFVQPPVANRGVGNTLEYEENVLIDWVQVTFLPNEKLLTEFDVFEQLFGLKSSDIILEDFGRYGYTKSYSYKNIRLYTCGRFALGFHLEMTGQACREFEELNISWLDFLKQCFYLNGRFTRIDIAIDLFTDKYFNINKIYSKVRKHEFRTKFQTVTNYEKNLTTDMSSLGQSITFGQRSSDIVIQFYDKLKEREQNNYILPSSLNFWNRVEVRLRHDKANSLMILYCDVNNSLDLGYYAKSILNNYLNFVDETDDTNKARWPVSKFWSKFLGCVDKLKLNKQDKYLDITNKRKWITESTSRTQFEVFVSSLDDLNIDSITIKYIYDILLAGFEKCENSKRFDLNIINDYRLKHGLNPYTKSDLKKIASDIRERYFIEEIKEQTY